MLADSLINSLDHFLKSNKLTSLETSAKTWILSILAYIVVLQILESVRYKTGSRLQIILREHVRKDEMIESKVCRKIHHVTTIEALAQSIVIGNRKSGADYLIFGKCLAIFHIQTNLHVRTERHIDAFVIVLLQLERHFDRRIHVERIHQRGICLQCSLNTGT